MKIVDINLEIKNKLKKSGLLDEMSNLEYIFEQMLCRVLTQLDLTFGDPHFNQLF